MATLQCKTIKGKQYWYLVESRRVNGKPRPIVLAYLGKADDLKQRLASLSKPALIKSYSYGLVYTLCDIAIQVDIVGIINRYSKASRAYMSEQPVINGFTAGETILLAALGRACRPTSKQGWINWAQTTSLSYLLGPVINKLDSQHFWDHMDCIPGDTLEAIEAELIENIWKQYKISTDTLLFDTTNFFTYINTTNKRCPIAKRGNNKQKRTDLRQIGYALVVTQKDHIPLFQHTYEGNQPDCITFRNVIEKIKKRLLLLNMDIEKHTLIFDKGMPTKANFAILDSLQCSYVTTIKSQGYKDLFSTFEKDAQQIEIEGQNILATKNIMNICGKERAVVVYLSERLREGLIRGYRDLIEKAIKQLAKVGSKMSGSKRKINHDSKKAQIKNIIGEKLKDLIEYRLEEKDGKTTLEYNIRDDLFQKMQQKMGYKILVSDRKEWTAAEVIRAYNGQAAVEEEFKNAKNPFHLSFRPQYHWTDQKIRVHFFICFIAHLLCRLLYKQASEKLKYTGQLNTLLEKLTTIRIAAYAMNDKKKYSVEYMLENTDKEQKRLIEAFSIGPQDNVTGRLFTVSVYK
jgi:transposase